MKVLFRVAMPAVVLAISGCTQVRTEGDRLVIANSLFTLLGLGAVGLLLGSIGVMILLEAFRKTFGGKQKKKRKSGSGIGGLLIAIPLGGVFIILGLVFLLYAAPATYYSTIVLEKDKLINKPSWGLVDRPSQEYPYSSISGLSIQFEDQLGRKMKTKKKEYLVIQTSGGYEERMEMNALWRAALPLLKERVQAANPGASLEN